MISGFSTHTAAEVNDLRVRAEKAEAASAAYKQQVAELEANLAENAEKTEILQFLLAKVLGKFREDCFASIPCREAHVSAAEWVLWLDVAREAGVSIPGEEGAGEDPQDGEDDGD